MKNLIAKLVVFLCSVLLFKQEVSAEKSDRIQLYGKPLFSFTQDHFIIETDKAYYKISKKGLPAPLLTKLEKSLINNKQIEFEIAQNKIEYSWPVVNSMSDSNRSTVHDVVSNEPSVIKDVKTGQLTLNGHFVSSFVDGEYLIQVNDTIYQIKKSNLPDSQVHELNKLSQGEDVHIFIPQESVHYSWSFKPQASRMMASIEEPDATSKNKTYTELTGTILYSANPATVAVQSKNSIYHLKKQSIVTEKPSLLDVHSSKVKLIIPNQDIEFSWTAKNAKNEKF